MSFDINNFLNNAPSSHQYEGQLERLRTAGKDVECIEIAVRGAVANLSSKATRSFVVYGEPQSGKTEMMICLTAKLLDQGHTFILHLLNDSVDLLGQNLGRFKTSGLAPAARNFSEILDPTIPVKSGRHVIFSKKNANDLRKLIDKIGSVEGIVVIDDEADYASPNSKINSGTKTRINELINQILGETGIYIGVTATPARLDLNNTFQNDSHLWVDFPPHSAYTGQDVFFPLDNKVDFSLQLLPNSGDEPKYARSALFRFLANVAYLNKYVNNSEENYSFLVHTSGKKTDHKSDWSVINSALNDLQDPKSSRFEKYVKEIWDVISTRYPDADVDELTRYVLNNITRNSLIIINSERDFSLRGASATNPSSLFTIIIGGNIVSRGVTLENLLSMFFTRDVRHKIQQDTYIQRARMFGSRGGYLRFFELTIPSALYSDWHRCFVFHRLALDAIRQKMGSLVWLTDQRIAAVSSSSIDRSTVDLNRGEMSFAIFDHTREIEKLVTSEKSSLQLMEELSQLLGDQSFPSYLRKYILRTLPKQSASLAFHPTGSIVKYTDANQKLIERRRGFIGTSDLQKGKYPHAIHHFKIYTNGEGRARLFYKFEGNIQFIKNLRNDT
ncbi:Z1 domain-containing protein [Nitratireductor indicus]|nr:Z1 domain-containing protein [Nitratireductor indicus]SFQ59792.1 Z1 domain-containing protein [Nitratireductor indicus]